MALSVVVCWLNSAQLGSKMYKKEKPKLPGWVLLTFGMALGGAMVGSYFETLKQREYDNAYEAALKKCQSPSKLELAAKWIAE